MFLDSFQEKKISKLRQGLIGVITDQTGCEERKCFTAPLLEFIPSTELEIYKIMITPKKTCGLDLFSSKQLKENIERLTPVVTKIINASLTSGAIPEVLEEAVVRHPWTRT